MTLFYIPNPTQYLNLTTTLLTINKQQSRSLLKGKTLRVNKCSLKCYRGYMVGFYMSYMTIMRTTY